MREERGNISANLIISESVDLTGTVVGEVAVIAKGKLYVRGAIYGNLTVDAGGRVHIYGNVGGDIVVNENAKVIISGVVGGDVINEGGRVYIDNAAQIQGKVKARSGITKVEPNAQVRE